MTNTVRAITAGSRGANSGPTFAEHGSPTERDTQHVHTTHQFESCQYSINLTTGRPEITLEGFLIEEIHETPGSALLRPEASVCWIDVECGRSAELRGAARLFALSRGAVIAIVTSQAYLSLFDGERVSIPVGIWRISKSE